MRASIKLTLGEPHLRALLRGGIVKTASQGVMVQMILKDIGFDVIQECFNDAKDGINPYVGHEEKSNDR